MSALLLATACHMSYAESQCGEVDYESVTLEEASERTLLRMDWPLADSLAFIQGDLAGHIYLGSPPAERGTPAPEGAIPVQVVIEPASNAVLRTTGGGPSFCEEEALDMLLEIQVVHDVWGVVASGMADLVLSEGSQYESFLEFTSPLDPRVFDALGVAEDQRPSVVAFRGHTIFAVPNEGPTCEHYGRLTDEEGLVELPAISFVWAPQ